MQTIFDVNYFINKFSAIPEDKWIKYAYHISNKCCALGHCGMTLDVERVSLVPEAKSLQTLLDHRVVSINDGDHPDYQQPTPKQRILAALYDIKKMQEPEWPERPDITKELAVLPAEEKLDIISPIKILQP